MDLLIGTHNLPGKDIPFQDLGLLVVDEEQRFEEWATRKKAEKKLTSQVDVLTLSATPMPPP